MTTVRSVLEGVCALVEAELPELAARRYAITWKPDGSPVTDADVYLERQVEAHLRTYYPDIRFIGEESFVESDADLAGWTAVLDPIDGTENFCSGLKEWGVSLTIWLDGHHEGSLLLLPELGERLITGDTFAPIRSRIVGFSSSISDELVRQVAATREARIIGCAVYNLFNVVRGSYSRFVNPVGAYSWDLLAGVQLALEHGCEVLIDGLPYDGRYLEPGRRYRVDIQHG
ncbi:inositol monophosphatase family protein [Demequina pelophila]|uniref:inositol monophosphatase family protein n=1 Tax=Demequina pelophila TaxID=1638984 RepID=UPI0007810BB0|nr:inositol monophosphatase family protein [Demequina pelophila]